MVVDCVFFKLFDDFFEFEMFVILDDGGVEEVVGEEGKKRFVFDCCFREVDMKC